MAQKTAFSPVTVAWLILVGLLSFAGAAYFTIYGDAGAARTAGANAYSFSAIGHRAFVETLRRLDIPVLVSRKDSAAKAGRSAVLIIAEPRGGPRTDAAIDDLLVAGRVLMVLPKWKGRVDEDRPNWLKSAALLPLAHVEKTLRHVVPDGRIKRVTVPVSWELEPIGVTPTLSAPQLMEATLLKPLVASDQGILVGELVLGEQRIWILSDPDLISNHGLGLGENAVHSVSLIEAIRPVGGTVIIDETIHGFRQEPSLARAMLEFPFVVATIQAVVTVLALVWAATGRFGAPVASTRPLEASKSALIDNAAGLLRYGGHGPQVLLRYVSVSLWDVARRMHAPREIDEAALIKWVDRVGEARGLWTKYRTLRSEVDAIAGAANAKSWRLVQAAQKVYRWKQEMINGLGDRRLSQSTAQGAGEEGGGRARSGR